MFALEECFTDAYKLIYSQFTLFPKLFRSSSNAIFSNKPSSKGLSFMECIEEQGILKLIMINVKVNHEDELPGVRSNITHFELPDVKLKIGEVDIMKIELVKSCFPTQEYILFLKIEGKDVGYISVVASFTYDMEQLLDGGQIQTTIHQITEEKLNTVDWVPSFNHQKRSFILTVGKSILNYFDIQQEGTYQQGQILKYEVFAETNSSIAGSAFLPIHRPFFQTVLVLMESNGNLFFCIPAAKQFQPETSEFKAFCSSYNKFSDSMGEFLFLQKECNHNKEKRTYDGIKIIDLNKQLIGVSLMILLSKKQLPGRIYEYRIDIFFISINKTSFILTPIADIIKNAPKSSEILFDYQYDLKVFFRFGKQICRLDLQKLVQLHMRKNQTAEEVRECIKFDLLLTFSDLKDLKAIRFVVIKEAYLIMLRVIDKTTQFQIHQIGSSNDKKRQKNISMFMNMINYEFSKRKSINSILDNKDIQKDLLLSENQSLEDYNKKIDDAILSFQKIIQAQYSALKQQQKEVSKLSQLFMDKIKVKVQKLAHLKERVQNNTKIFDELYEKELLEIRNELHEDEKTKELMEKLRFAYLKTETVQIDYKSQMSLNVKINDQNLRVKQTHNLINALESIILVQENIVNQVSNVHQNM